MHRHITRTQKAFRADKEDLSKRVINGAAFTILGIALRTSITVGAMAILARILAPADFGYIAMATVITELAALFSNFGFGSILIQQQRVIRIQLDTMHWCAVGLGIFLTVFVFCFSYFGSFIFKDEMVGSLLKLMSINFILDQLSTVPRSVLMRQLHFKLDFIIQIMSKLAGATAAIFLAIDGFGVWSLVGGAIAGFGISAIANTVGTGYLPRLRFSMVFLKSTWKINGSHFGNGVLFYINASTDIFLLGRLVGANMLGQYQNARSLTDEVYVRMAQPLQRVLFPAFAAMQNQPDKLREGILRSGKLLAFIFIPIGFGLASVAPELVQVLYGSQWLPMIPILQIIAIAGGLSAVSTLAASIFNAANRTELLFRLNMVQTVINIGLILFCSQWGIIGVAWARLVGVFVIFIFFRYALFAAQLKIQHLWVMMGPPIEAAMIMALIIYVVRIYLLSYSYNNLINLIILIAIGVIIYLAMAFVLAKEHVDEVKTVLVKFGLVSQGVS